MRRGVAPLLLLAASLSGCEYLRLTRPSLLKQLNPDLVRLVNSLPDMDRPNEAVVARLIGHGGLVRANEAADGVFRARVDVPPSVHLAARRDRDAPWRRVGAGVPQRRPFSLHAAILPSNDGTQFIAFPSYTAGLVRLRLNQPGLYSFDCPVANHAGRGMVGLILVSGEVPAEAKLDRPRQRRP